MCYHLQEGTIAKLKVVVLAEGENFEFKMALGNAKRKIKCRERDFFSKHTSIGMADY